jgi:RND superfamily putative drug exporter
MQPTRNIAARAGRWSARHRKAAIFGWLAFVIVAVFIGSSMGTKNLTDQESGVGDSGTAEKALFHHFPQQSSETVLIQSKTGDASDPAFKAAVTQVVHRVSAVKHVKNVQRGDVSKDGHSQLVTLDLMDGKDQADTRVEPVLHAVAGVQRAHPDLRVEQFGDASLDRALSKSSDADFQRAEVSSLPLTLIILVFAFGALVAAGIPVLLAITGVAATIGLLGPISHLAPVSESISSVILLIGLAVGVDYALFYIRREREERAAGRGEQAALEAAAATSGRAVLISGMTVIIAMAGMYFAGASVFSSFATGTILVVAIAMLSSVTVLPAVLSKLGDRVDKGRIPFLGRRRGESRIWAAVLDRVLRRPLVSAIAAAAVLIALVIPAFGMHTALPGTDSFSRDLSVMRTYDRIQAAFPGQSIPAEVVVQARDVTTPEMKAAIADLEREAISKPHLMGPAQIHVSPDHTVAEVAFRIAGDGSIAPSQSAVRELRDDAVPATVGDVTGVQAHVTGFTAGTQDFNDVMKSHIALVFAFVLSLAFLLLLVTFRSLVIPVKAIVLNLLSVGAAYGVLTLVFEHGVGQGLLGFDHTGPITAWLPLFLFVVLFGLSMDYHVFILSRIREAFDRGESTEDAVAHGIKSTAGTVTSAAIVMVGVFAIFATLTSIDMKQMGVGLAAAVLIDATIIRAVLLPATMKLLGDWNWWLPRKLGWLPKVAREPEVAHGQAYG